MFKTYSRFERWQWHFELRDDQRERLGLQSNLLECPREVLVLAPLCVSERGMIFSVSHLIVSGHIDRSKEASVLSNNLRKSEPIDRSNSPS